MNPPNSQHQGSGGASPPGQPWFSSTISDVGSDASGSQPQTGDGGTGGFAASFLLLGSTLRQRLQPWSEFFKLSKFGLPPSCSGIGPRVKRNMLFFLSNYLCLFVVLLILSILSSVLLMLTLLVLTGLCYTIYQRTKKGPVKIVNYEVPPSLLYTMALVICFPLFAFSGASQVIYWVIASGLFLMLVHATFFCSEEVPGGEFEVVTVVPIA